MKPKKKSPKRKSAKHPTAARRTATRKAWAVAPRQFTSSIATKSKRTVAKRNLAGGKSVTHATRLPAILFEGDRPTPPRLSGPGEKYTLGDRSPAQELEASELPEAYGTGRLSVITRDPHWLYVHWDFTREQQRHFNAQSAHGHLMLRTYIGAPGSRPVSEIHVHPESRHWFAHVERAATEYVAELGYYGSDHQWTTVATSTATITPPDTPSPDATVTFATIPVETPFEKLLARVKQAAWENVPLTQALEQLSQRAHPELSAAEAAQASQWTPEREHGLAEVIRVYTSPCAWMDSLEITQLIQGRPERDVSSPGTVEFEQTASPAGVEESTTSPSGGPPPGAKGFWFNVHAELVIYGATERDATVTLGGREIILRPDGSFSVRFALPDGQHELPVLAVSADGTEWRAAELKFKRTTEFVGDIGMPPQDLTLKPPTPNHVR